MNSTASEATKSTYPSAPVIWGIAAVFVIVGGTALLVLPNLLLLNWFPGSDEKERRALLASAAQIILFALGGVIAVVGVALSLSRHGQELEANARDRAHAVRLQEAHDAEKTRRDQQVEDAQSTRIKEAERELRTRFISAIDLLSSESSTRRAAAMHALGALADDWAGLSREDEVQVCIDMLCMYLRSPAAGVPTEPDEVTVRQVGYQILRNHLRVGARISWSKYRVVLAHAHIDFDANLSEIQVDQALDLTGIVISGRGRLHLNKITVEEFRKVSLRGAILKENAGLDFSSSKLKNGGAINLRGARLFGKANLYLKNAQLEGHADINLLTAEVDDDARIHMRGATVNGGAAIRLRGGLNWSPAIGTALTKRDLPPSHASAPDTVVE